MTGTTDVSIALLGTAGALAFSLLTSNTIKYFVGVGFFGIVFLLTYVLFYDLNISMFSGLVSAVLVGILFEWISMKADLVSAILLVAVATVGFLLLVAILLNLRFQRLDIPVFVIKRIQKPNVSFIKQLEHAIRLMK